ncbi:MAG: hypothetical protein JST30_05265 [Armatimonadetes bacterium]|nr:hypothetical protein [Armatimonadota bacterium]
MKRTTVFAVGAAFAVLLSVGCAPQQEPTKVGLSDDRLPKLRAGDKETVLVPHPVTEEIAAAAQERPKPEPKKPLLEKKGSFKAGKTDPTVYGDYQIEVTDETKRQLDNGIRKLREQGANGDPKAATALEYAEAAQQAAERMSIQLREDGKFFADFVTGKSFGTYRMDGLNVRLLPNEVLTEAGSPTSFDLTYDKGAKKLTLQLQGSELVFVKVKTPRSN